MTNLRPAALPLGLLALLAALVLGWPRGATADKPAVVAACPQWEVMLSQPTRVTIDAKSLPEAGKAVVEQAPAGWEPFAFTPAGQLVYRRCTRAMATP
jgi:hypothetical protein